MSYRDTNEDKNGEAGTKPSLKERIAGLFTNVWIIAFLVIILVVSLYPIIMLFIGLWGKCNGHLGYFLLNLIVIPFIFFGGTNFVRGACAVVEKDEKHFDTYWKFVVYLIGTIIGYIALFHIVSLGLN